MGLVGVQWSRLAEELSDLLFLLEHPLYDRRPNLPVGELFFRGYPQDWEQVISDRILQEFCGVKRVSLWWDMRESQWRELKKQTLRVAAFIPREPDIPDCKSWEHAELDRLWSELHRLRDAGAMDGEEWLYMPTAELDDFATNLRRFFDDSRNPAGLRLVRYMSNQPTPRLRVVSPPEERSQDEVCPIVLTADEKLILQFLHENSGISFTQGMLMDELQKQGLYRSEKTLRACLSKLRSDGLIDRPRGPHKGDAISAAGRKLLEK